MIRYALTRWHRFVHGEDIFDAWPGSDAPGTLAPRRSQPAAPAVPEDRRVAVGA